MKTSAQVNVLRNIHTRFRKPTSFALVFLFLITPFAQVFAQEAPAPAESPAPAPASDSAPAADTPVIEPAPSDIIAPASAVDTVTPTIDPAPLPVVEDLIVTPPLDKTKPKDTTPPPSTMSMSSNPSDIYGPVAVGSQPNQDQLAPTPDSSTGAMVYSYKIEVPPGRNGMQPDLKLQYNSQNTKQDSIFGFGWSANIPYISRENVKGVSTIFTDNYFTSSLSGDLVNTSGSSYVSKTENGGFLKYTFTSNTWTVIDKSGTVYTFGATSSTRQDNPNDSSKIYKWMLEKMQDANGNFVSYTYYKNGGQIYPDTITYTNNSAGTGIFTVVFTRESRGDIIHSATSGFDVTTNYRISRIESSVSGTWVRRYDLAYTTQSPTLRSLLSTVTSSGKENGVTTTLAPSTFNYQDAVTGEHSLINPAWTMPDDQYSIDFYTMTSSSSPPQVSGHNIKVSLNTTPISDGSVRADLADVNGDGLADIVQSYRCVSASGCMGSQYAGLDKTYVYLNTGSGWSYNSSWSMPADQFSIDYWTMLGQTPPQVSGHDIWIDLNTPHTPDPTINMSGEMVDVNGDGLVDIVQSFRCLNTGCMGASYAGLDKTYVYLNTGNGWSYNSSWSMPADQFSIDYYTMVGQSLPQVSGHNILMSLNTNPAKPYYSSEYAQWLGGLADVNGDGLVDIVQSFRCLNNGCMGASYAGLDKTYIYLNTGSGWSYDSTWTMPANQYSIDRSDMFGQSHLQVSGHDVKISLNTTPILDNLDGTPRGELHDINGDGLVDIIQSYRCLNTGCMGASYAGLDKTYVYLNTGNGWSYNASTTMPADQFSIDYYTMIGQTPPQVSGHNIWIDLNTPHAFDPSINMSGELIDVNKDNLPDIVQSFRCLNTGCVGASFAGLDKTYTYLNTGSGWSYTASTTIPADQFSIDYYTMVGQSPPQVSGHDVKISLNTNPAKPYYSSEYAMWLAGLSDINGDNLPDIVQSYRVSPFSTYSGLDKTYLYSNIGNPPLLSAVTFPEGGSYSLGYKAAPQYMNGGTLLNPNLPFSIQTLNQMVVKDGLGNVATTSYSYENGSYYYDSNDLTTRRFAGFGTVTKTDPTGNVAKTYYHQGNTSDSSHGEYSDEYWKIGKIYRTEQYDNASHLYSKTINKWDSYSLGSGAKFVKLAQSVSSTYDGDSSHKDKGDAFAYDNTTGNLAQKISYGEVTGADDGTFTDTGSDLASTTIQYAASSSAVYLPSQETTQDQSANKVRETKHYYDGQSLGALTKGNLTKQEMWKSGSSYASTTKTYDGVYGLVTQEKDGKGNATNYTYDPYNLFVATSTNPLGYTRNFLYDYSSGKVATTTDENGRIFANLFDGLDRLKEERQPDITTPSTLVTKAAYTYTDTSLAVATQKTSYLTSGTSTSAYEYKDGLGRTLQIRSQAEGGNYAVKDFIYDSRGFLQKESLPYFSAGSSKTTATATSSLFTNYFYDPMGRIGTTTNAVGTTTNLYNDWTVTTTDAKGNIKDFTKDAYGNLASVVEHNGSNYTTAYSYDRANNLTGITDALSNIRAFTYDGMGRRLTAQDLHASGDGTFGSYTFAYDDAGNQTQRVDPKSQTVNWTYDALNRPLTEDYTGGTGTEVAYTYDSGTDGKTRLTQAVALNSATTTYAYNPLGQTKTETKTIAGTSYATTYDYDRQGNQTLITYSDLAQVRYTFNTAGLLDKVEQKENAGSFANIVSNFDYAPTGQPTTIAYANGVNTTNTYDANALYRMTNKVAVQPNAKHAQDLAYLYDPISNITRITDVSDTATKKTSDYTYDNLSRLLSATITNATTTPNYTQNFTYDALGNILTAPLGTYAYAGTNYANPHAVTSIGSSVSGTSTRMSDITLDATSTSGEQTNVSSVTYSHTTGTLTNGLIIVEIQIRNSNNNTFTGASGVTYNGNALTLAKVQNGPTANNRYLRSEIWYGIAPAAGAHNVVATFSASVWDVNVGTITLSGVDQSNPLDATGGANPGSATSETTNITTVANNAMVFDSLFTSTGSAITLGAGQSQLWQLNTTASNDRAAASYRGSFTVASSTSMSWSGGGSEDWASAAASFKPVHSNGYGTTTYAVYSNSSLNSGWDDWSWGTALTLNSTEQVYSGTSAMKAVYSAAWQAASFHNNGINTTGSTHLEFAVRATTTNPNLLVEAYDSNLNFIANVPISNYIPGGIIANTWYLVDIPLADFGAANKTITRFSFMDGAAGTVYYDDIRFINYPNGGSTNTYDNNGNLTSDGTWTHTYDYQNRLTQSTKTGATSTSAYDHAGNRTKLTEGSTTTYFPNTLYNVTGTTATKHIFANSASVATVESGAGGGSGTISLDATSTSGEKTNVSSVTFSHTTGTLSNGIIAVELQIRNSSNGVFTGASGVTYNGTALTLAKVQNGDAADGRYLRSEIWYGTAPASGAHNVVATLSASVQRLNVGAITLSGVDQSNPLDATAGTYSTAGTMTTNITTVNNDSLVIDSVYATCDNAVTVGSGQTEQYQIPANAGFDHPSASTKVTTSAGTTGMSWTCSYSDYWASAVASFKPASGGSASTTIRYVHTDNLSGSNVITDQNGAIAETLDYYPYGGARIDSKVGNYGGEKRKFIGQEYDNQSGLSFLNARYYNSSRGQFISQDPVFWEVGQTSDGKKALLDPQAQNSYSYANGNPINKSDPNGRFVQIASLFFGLFSPTEAYAPGNETDLNASISGMQAGFMAAEIVATQGRTAGVKAAEKGFTSVAEKAVGKTTSQIGATGKIGEDALKTLGGQSQVYFKTPIGGRVVDQLVGGVANESKVGYTSLTQKVSSQIAKDKALVSSNAVQGATWNFFKSPVTGLNGPSAPLQNALRQAGLGVITHDK